MANQLPGPVSQLKKEAGRQRQNPDVWLRLALQCVQSGCAEEARDAYQHLTRLQPDNWLAWFGLANQQYGLGQYPEALDHYFKALSIHQTSVDIRNNLALLLRFLGEHALAEQLWLEAVDLQPDAQDVLNNLGNLYRDWQQFDKAHLCLDTALQLSPDSPQVLNNLGLLYKEQGRLDDALAVYRQAVALPDVPHPPELAYNYAIALIQSGDWLRGYQWYEQRWSLPRLAAQQAAYNAQLPAWQGEFLGGKTVLLWNEQGLGDMIQMARLLPAWRASLPDCRVLLRVDPLLLPLLSGVAGVDQVLSSAAPLPAADYHLSVMSLPMQLRLTPETLPGTARYLTADAARVADWSARLPARGSRPRLGLVWQSGDAGVGPQALDHRSRSLPDTALRQLLALPGVEWVSLQVGGQALAEDLAAQVCQPGPLRDFADTAAIVAQLDGMVSVDTAAGHLAAALGVPTVVLMRATGGNLFPAHGDTMPWYADMRLLRQVTLHDWATVLPQLPSFLSQLGVKTVAETQ